MKKTDLFAILFVACILCVFIIPASREVYNRAYQDVPVLLSFFKFALLATFGEMLILRLQTGGYWNKQFGIMPKAIVWGVLGISLYYAFTIFYGGVNWLLFKGGEAPDFLHQLKFSFLVSFFMNIFYAPILMLTHHITDLHILNNKGYFQLTNFSALQLLRQIDWDKMWSFVIKRTIPLFWIPVHTITFLLPEQYRVLIAAILSIVLGLFLARVKPTK